MSKIKNQFKLAACSEGNAKIFLYVYYAGHGEMEINALETGHTWYTHIVFNSSDTKIRVINLEKILQ